MTDTMMTFNSQNLENNFMTEEDIRRVCPVAFATEPTNKVSDKYVVANTWTVIQDMEKLGWKVVKAKQKKSIASSKGRFSYHMIAFQNPDVKIVKTVVNPDGTRNEETDCYPQIILINSHDGFSSFKFMVGCFRLVCSNGLVIWTDKFADMKIRHISYSFEELRQLISNAIQELPNQISMMDRMYKVILSEEQKKDFALKALKIRKGLSVDDELKVKEETIEEMLTPVRPEDESNDLFTVFNVLQEKCIRGGFTVTKEGSEKKGRSVRKVSSFVKDLEINKNLWILAQSYMN